MKTRPVPELIFLSLIMLLALVACSPTEASSENVHIDTPDSQSVLIPLGADTVEAIGVLRSSQTAELSWNTAGIVQDVYVESGQIVEDGDLLAELELASVSTDVILAESSLYQANEALDGLYEAYDETALAELATDLAEAQQAVNNAERLISDMTKSPDLNTVDQAYAQMIIAEGKLEDAEARLAKHIKNRHDRRWSRPFAGINAYYDQLTNLQAQVSQKQFEYDKTVAAYTDLIDGPDATALAVVQADLKYAQQQVLQYEAEYERLLLGPSEVEINSYEKVVAAAQAAADGIYIKAPFGGTITRVDVQVGDPVSTSELAIRIDDLSSYFVDVEILEVDRNQVAHGQRVEVSFDALPGKSYAGEVIAVVEAETSTDEVSRYKVSVRLLESGDAFRPGMTASVTIYVE